MKHLTLVMDAPVAGRGPFNGSDGEVLLATIRGVIGATGKKPPEDIRDLVDVLYVSSEPTPGGKPPRIGVIREEHPRLMAELGSEPRRMILAVGASACAAMAGVGQPKIVATPITKWRGQMRWLELPYAGARVRPRLPWMATISPGSVVKKNDYYRDLSFDLWKAWTQDAPLPEPEVEVHVPRTIDDLRAALALLDGASMVTCDVETTGLRPWVDKLISVAFGAVGQDLQYGVAVVAPYELMNDPEAVDLCWEYVWRSTRRTVWQNGKFDMQYMIGWFGEGIPRDAMIGDTLVLGYLLDERSKMARMSSLGLKEQASYRYDKQDYHWDWDKFYADMRHDGTYPPGSARERVRTCVRDGDPKLRCKHDHVDGFDVVRASRGEDPWSPRETDVADMAGLYAYQALDVYYTARLWYDLVGEAAEEPDSRIMEVHDEVLMPAAKTLAACELVGAPLDVEWLKTYAAWLRRRLDRRSSALTRVGARLGAPEDLDLASPAQVADLMYDAWQMTPDVRKKKRFGADGEKQDRSTDKEHIEAAILKYVKGDGLIPGRKRPYTLAKAARWLRMLLRWRTESKQLSTYSESILEKADAGGRIHASFWLHGTVTGRLSSSAPNLQNIPAVDDKVYEADGRVVYKLRGDKATRWPARKGFAPPPGYDWLEIDYSQLELRVAAWLADDQKLKDVFINGRDIHREVAATMFSKPAELITKPERYLAKAVDFGILYGRQGKAIAEGVEMDFYENVLGGKRWDALTAEAFLKKFLRGYPQLGAWLESNAAGAVENYFVESPFGRRRRFPFKPRTKWDRMAIERQANNTPIQSAASDLCLMAMWRIAPRLPEGATMLFPVHDSICLEVRRDLVEEVTRIAREEMEQTVGGVPLTVDVEVGSSWADVH